MIYMCIDINVIYVHIYIYIYIYVYIYMYMYTHTYNINPSKHYTYWTMERSTMHFKFGKSTISSGCLEVLRNAGLDPEKASMGTRLGFDEGRWTSMRFDMKHLYMIYIYNMYVILMKTYGRGNIVSTFGPHSEVGEIHHSSSCCAHLLWALHAFAPTQGSEAWIIW